MWSYRFLSYFLLSYLVWHAGAQNPQMQSRSVTYSFQMLPNHSPHPQQKGASLPPFTEQGVLADLHHIIVLFFLGQASIWGILAGKFDATAILLKAGANTDICNDRGKSAACFLQEMHVNMPPSLVLTPAPAQNPPDLEEENDSFSIWESVQMILLMLKMVLM